MREVLNPTSPAQFGGAPYGDAMEVSGPPVVVSYPLPFRPFFFTDARSVLIVLAPRNINLIYNPSFRKDLANWRVDGLTTSLDADDSWVGKSVSVTGDGTMRPAQDDHFVYVGPSYIDPDGESGVLEAAEMMSSPDGWVLSAFFKGTGEYRLMMRAYTVDISLGKDAPYSAPKNISAPQVNDPVAAPYDDTKPVVVDNTGIIWKLNDPPFYTLIGKCPRFSDPSVLPSANPGRYVLDAGAVPSLWRAITPDPGGPPYYERLGETETAMVDGYGDLSPEMLPPTGGNYLLTSSRTGNPLTNDRVWIKNPGPPWYTSTGSGPAIASVAGPWSAAVPGEWSRAFLRTGTKRGVGEAFNSAWWIDAWIEVRNATDLKISSVMLGQHEEDTPPYFDGGILETSGKDDFIWRDPGKPDESASEYYPDRVVKTRWIYDYLQYLVPVGRPYQIYYGDYSRPYVPGGDFGLPARRKVKDLLV